MLEHIANAMGSRLLKHCVHRPLCSRGVMLENQIYQPLQDLLCGISDIERILACVALESARPRDLAQLRNALGLLPALHEQLAAIEPETPRMRELAQLIGTHPCMQPRLAHPLVENPPILIRDGGVIAPGFDAELDELRALRENAGDYPMALEARERNLTGIANLKVNYNRVDSYYIEVTCNHSEKIPVDYRRYQTLKGVERYITPELKSFEDTALSAALRADTREKMLYDALLDELVAHLTALQGSAGGLANLNERADTLNWSSPELSDMPGITIKDRRHPVVESPLDRPFVPNDIELNETRRLLIITGQKISSKFIYMRQVALIMLLAHIGSFVSAAYTVIAPVDRVFARIGSSDALAGGRSTFMVEMTETATILHNAMRARVVLMDEIGRGTSSFDGVALAWACLYPLAERLGD